jgi:hypothetical protein
MGGKDSFCAGCWFHSDSLCVILYIRRAMLGRIFLSKSFGGKVSIAGTLTAPVFCHGTGPGFFVNVSESKTIARL